MSTAANGVSLLGLQEQLAAIAAVVASMGGTAVAQPDTGTVAEVPIVAALANGKGRKKAAVVAQVAETAGVPVLSGLPSYTPKTGKSDKGAMGNVVILARLPDGTAVKMGCHPEFGFGFQIGEGRAKFAMGAKWLVISQLGPQIAQYVNSHSK
jgi:glutamine amidotransferase-like uncharacterized protein